MRTVTLAAVAGVLLMVTMEPVRNVILTGDTRQELAKIPDETVQCVVTSPPYWGLRDYGTAQWEGGDAECDHIEQRGGRDPATSSKQLTSTGTINTQYNHGLTDTRAGGRGVAGRIRKLRQPEGGEVNAVQNPRH